MDIRTVSLFSFTLCLASWAEGQSEKTPVAYQPQPQLNQAYALERKPSKQVQAEYQFTVRAPNLKAQEWVLFASSPPTLPSQTVNIASLTPHGRTISELSPLQRSLFMARIPASVEQNSQTVTVKLQTRAELYSRNLVPRRVAGKQSDFSLSAEKAAAALGDNDLLKLDSKVLGSWLDEHGLHPRPREGEIDFARRVFLTIKQRFKYVYESDMDRTVSRMCVAEKSDCGGMALMFTAAMRKHGIPARLLVGRWANSAKAGETVGDITYYQEHVKAEFFAAGVGWVPVDLSSGVLHDKSREGLRYFGHDPGDFITLHVDCLLMVDTIHFGKEPITWLQGAQYWVTGSGNLDATKIEEKWTVK